MGVPPDSPAPALPSQLDIALHRAAEDCSISPDSPVARFSSAF